MLAMNDHKDSVFSSKQAGFLLLCSGLLAFVLFPVFATPIFLVIGVLNTAGAITFISSGRKNKI